MFTTENFEDRYILYRLSVTDSVTVSLMFNRYQTKAKVVLGRPVRAHQGRRSAQPARWPSQTGQTYTVDRLLVHLIAF